jgi:hypothetical protein
MRGINHTLERALPTCWPRQRPCRSAGHSHMSMPHRPSETSMIFNMPLSHTLKFGMSTFSALLAIPPSNSNRQNCGGEQREQPRRVVAAVTDCARAAGLVRGRAHAATRGATSAARAWIGATAGTAGAALPATPTCRCGTARTLSIGTAATRTGHATKSSARAGVAAGTIACRTR